MAITNASATWTDGERFVGQGSSGHAFMIDADRQRNSAPGPMEYVLIALCGCTATDVVSILTKKREKFTSLSVRAEGERAAEPPTVYKNIKLIYTVGGAVSKKAVEDAVKLSKDKYCSVSQMLQKTAAITTEIDYI
jgi:putative redox protein